MTAAVLLAAGASRRMGGPFKLTLPVGGTAMVRAAAEALILAEFRPLVVVVGGTSAEVERALGGLPVRLVFNPRWSRGIGTSIAAGIAAVPERTDSVAVALGDMPNIAPATMRTLRSAFEAARETIALPTYRGRRGHPVIFDLLEYRAHLSGLCGDEGARSVLQAHPREVLELAVDDPGVVADVDTRRDYQRILSQVAGPVGGERR